MIFLTELATTGLLLLAGNDPNFCRPPRPPRINIIPKTATTRFDYTMSSADLGSFHIDTQSPYHKEEVAKVGGLHRGAFEIKQQITFETYEKAGYSCVWYSEINIEISLAPVVYVAKEYPRGTCMHSAIKQHELKHIKVDRVMVNKYAQKLGSALFDDLQKNGSSTGPGSRSDIPRMQQYLNARAQNLTQYISRQLDDERMRQQNLIDSFEEYERVRLSCPQTEAQVR